MSRRITARDNVDVVLVDKNNEHVYSPLLYEVASGGLRECMPRRKIGSGVAIKMNYEGRLIDHPSVQFRQGLVTSIDFKKQFVSLQSGAKIKFDYLVCAFGAGVNTFGVPGIKEHALPLKTLDNAHAIHKRLCSLIHELGASNDLCVDVMIAGGGPSGVETAAELATAFQSAKLGGGINCTWRIMLVDGSERILSSLAPRVSKRASIRLRSLGVEIFSGTMVKEVGHTWAALMPNMGLEEQVSPLSKEGVIEADAIIWTAGIGANKQWAEWGMPVSKRGWVEVDASLKVKGMRNVFAIGDMASVEGEKMQQIAPVAMSHAKHAADNIYRLMGGVPLKNYKSVTWPYAIPLGGSYALAQYRSISFYGIIGYVFRKVVDLRYFLSILSFGHALSVWFNGGRMYLDNDV